MRTTRHDSSKQKQQICGDTFLKLFTDTQWVDLLKMFKTIEIKPEFLNMLYGDNTIIMSLFEYREWDCIEYLQTQKLLNKTHFNEPEFAFAYLAQDKQWKLLHLFVEEQFIPESLLQDLPETDLAEISKFHDDAIFHHQHILRLIALSMFFPKVISETILDYLKPMFFKGFSPNEFLTSIDTYKTSFSEQLATESVEFYALNFDYEKASLPDHYLKVLKTLVQHELLSQPYLCLNDNFKKTVITLMADLGIGGILLNRNSVKDFVAKAVYMNNTFSSEVRQDLNNTQEINLHSIDKLVTKIGFYREYKPIKSNEESKHRFNFRPYASKTT